MEKIRNTLLNDIPSIVNGSIFFNADGDLIHVVLGLSCDGFVIIRIETPNENFAPLDLFSPLQLREAEFRVQAAIFAHEQSIWIVKSMFGEMLAA